MYLFELAERLHMTVGRLSREITSDEISEWLGFDQVRPNTDLEHRFADLQHTIVATIAAIFDGRPPAREIFLPRRHQPEQTCDQMKAVFLASCAGLPRE